MLNRVYLLLSAALIHALCMFQLLHADTYRMSCHKVDVAVYQCGSGRDVMPNKEQKNGVYFAPVARPMYTALAHTYPDESSSHRGVDVVGSSEILPVSNGRVVEVCARIFLCGSYGKYVLIEHNAQLFSLYAHLAHVSVVVGQQVERQAEDIGTLLGLMGDTGASQGVHLHFEMRDNQSHGYEHRLDPLQFLSVHIEECSNVFGLKKALLSGTHRYNTWYHVNKSGVIESLQKRIIM